jgi:hypothetical protein
MITGEWPSSEVCELARAGPPCFSQAFEPQRLLASGIDPIKPRPASRRERPAATAALDLPEFEPRADRDRGARGRLVISLAVQAQLHDRGAWPEALRVRHMHHGLKFARLQSQRARRKV